MKRTYTLRAPGNYDTDEASAEAALDPNLENDPSRTQQSFKEESDINEIVRRFGLTGEMPTDLEMPQSGDFSEAPDFQTAMNMVRAAQEEFMRVPAHIRAEFGNDPQRLMSFLEDEDNRAKALKMGLIQAPPEKTRDMVQAVDELREALTTPTEKK